MYVGDELLFVYFVGMDTDRWFYIDSFGWHSLYLY